MSLFTDTDDRDWLRSELIAQDRAERARLRPHWCRDCLGWTGPGSPCAPEEEDEPEQIEDEQESD